MDTDIKILIKKVIKEELGEIVAEEIKKQFEPIGKQIELIRTENRNSYDNISRQITEDRRDINTSSVNIAKIARATGVIIENQNNAEEKMIEAVKEQVEKIPEVTEKAVGNMFENKPFLTKIKEKFIKAGGKK